ncbi:uncharacterized protein ARMOST_14843 [Armillaria ostoyae]|uniref:Uncharacterized protein n=1 Tax=Armillaria ostoyae TaxID=47428 RepID=A0A284RRQ2_ARMOS|nr:uncharacterized protein ARMOST_14843 [Armillaria ostoyae]
MKFLSLLMSAMAIKRDEDERRHLQARHTAIVESGPVVIRFWMRNFKEDARRRWDIYLGRYVLSGILSGS